MNKHYFNNKQYFLRCFFKIFSLFLLLFSHSTSIYTKNITVLGTGYVGLVLGTGLAYFGNNVTCVDVDQEKINALNAGKIPIFEPGLEQIIKKETTFEKLSFTTDITSALQQADVIFIAVGTPQNADGTANLSFIDSAAKMIGQNLNNYKIIITKSTVPIGTGKRIKNIIASYANPTINFDVVSNPEFLKEGDAVNDFLNPSRIVIGAETEEALNVMKEIYAPLLAKKIPLIATDLPTAETIKYAANSFLAIKISYINEIAQLCEKTNANIEKVAAGIGLDPRIGNQFLKPGPGFGGSCFPKDILALSKTAENVNVKLSILEAAIEANKRQKEFIQEKIYKALNYELHNKKIAILGLAFKANTDDVRDSAAHDIIKGLLDKKATIKAYDPIANENMKKELPSITYSKSVYEAATGADVLVILTEWPEFKNLNFSILKEKMNNTIIVDARNILNSKTIKQLGFEYYNIGNA